MLKDGISVLLHNQKSVSLDYLYHHPLDLCYICGGIQQICLIHSNHSLSSVKGLLVLQSDIFTPQLLSHLILLTSCHYEEINSSFKPNLMSLPAQMIYHL